MLKDTWSDSWNRDNLLQKKIEKTTQFKWVKITKTRYLDHITKISP
jgi:hypothetical protein